MLKHKEGGPPHVTPQGNLARFPQLKSQAEIDAEAWPAKRRLFAIAATCGAMLTAILIAVDPIRWVL